MRPGSFNQFKGSRCSPRPAALLVVFFGALALAGCSKDLSRNAAAALIEGDESFKSTFDVKLPVGRFWYDWRNIRNINDYFPIKALEAAGILSFKESGKSDGWWLKEYVVDLTEAGQKEAHSWVKTSEKVSPFYASPDATVYRIPLARRKLLEVTGIATDAGGKQAHIEYKWKWIPTPQGRLLPDKIPPEEVHDGSAIAQLYDDGWRLIR